METTKYHIKLTFIEPMLGTVPYNPEVYKRFIESKKPEDQQEDESKTVESRELSGWTGFHKDDDGLLFIYDYMIKGFLKAASDVIKSSDKTNPNRGLKQRIDRFVFVFPRQISLEVKDADGILERPLRAMTMQGPRVSVVRSDFIKKGRSLEFEIHILEQGVMGRNTLENLLDYGKYKGLGQFRNGSYGRFTYTLKAV